MKNLTEEQRIAVVDKIVICTVYSGSIKADRIFYTQHRLRWILFSVL